MKTVDKMVWDLVGTTFWCPGRPVAFQLQSGRRTLWFEPGLGHTCMVVGTLWEVPDTFDYVATLQEHELVWHLYSHPVAPAPNPFFRGQIPVDGASIGADGISEDDEA